MFTFEQDLLLYIVLIIVWGTAFFLWLSKSGRYRIHEPHPDPYIEACRKDPGKAYRWNPVAPPYNR